MLDAIHEEEISGFAPFSAISSEHGKVSIQDRMDKETIEKTLPLASSLMAHTEQPSPADEKKLVGRVTQGAPQEPNLCLEVILAALEKERFGNRQLDEYVKEAEGHQRTIDKHLEARAKLDVFPQDKKSHELTPELKALLEELGVWKGDNQISKDQLLQVRSSLSANTDQARSKVQLLITTKMQTVLQNSSAIMEITKESIKTFARLISTIIGHYARNS